MPRSDYRRKRRESGLCVYCPNETGGRTARCKKCSQKEDERRKRKAAGRAARLHPMQYGVDI